jgi:hypothetical protein
LVGDFTFNERLKPRPRQGGEYAAAFRFERACYAANQNEWVKAIIVRIEESRRIAADVRKGFDIDIVQQLQGVRKWGITIPTRPQRPPSRLPTQPRCACPTPSATPFAPLSIA